MVQTNKNSVDYNETFSSRLRNLMSNPHKTVTRQELANELGISPQQVSNYAVGVSLPDYKSLYKMAKFFNVSADYLLGLQELKSPDTDIQNIHNKLGLSEETIKLLIEQVNYLREITIEKQSAKAIDKFNSAQREAANSPYLHFADYIDHYKQKDFNIDFSDGCACSEANLFAPYSYIFNEIVGDEYESGVLGELYDLMIFIEADSVFIPVEYDYDDLLAIRLVRLQRAFMKWVNRKLGRQ